MKRLALLFVSLLWLCACAPDQPTSPSSIAEATAEPRPDMLLEDVRVLSADDMEGRLAGSPGGDKARIYILDRFRQIGLSPALGDDFVHPVVVKRDKQTFSGANLLAMVKGTGPSPQVLVVMAHYDHVGTKAGEIYNGADDNASGVATLLMIAESLKQSPPQHDIVLAVVDAEEGGMQGSRAMVADPAFRPLLDRTVVAVNFDMLSRSDKNELYVAGAYHFPWLRPRLEAIAGEAPVKLLLGHDSPEPKADDWTTQSDHVAFQLIGRPWVYLGVEDHPDYHRPTDDFAAIPQDFFRRSAATAELVVRTLDRDLEPVAAEAGR
jgi:Zn-dependent M28 family amino/carboxypeptidase